MIASGLTLGVATQAQAHSHTVDWMDAPASICCSEKVEVPITPVDLVSAGYQGRLPGIPGFAVFNQKVLSGNITGEDLVRVAYYQYRATYEDLSGETTLIKDVDRLLDVYGRSQ